MKTKTLYILIALLTIIDIEISGQTIVNGHTGFTPSTEYVGWDGSTSIPLDIRHNGNHEINFYTDSIFRMIIDPAGLVGIGTNILFC